MRACVTKWVDELQITCEDAGSGPILAPEKRIFSISDKRPRTPRGTRGVTPRRRLIAITRTDPPDRRYRRWPVADLPRQPS